jgi:DNA-binding NtrC family response regulator
MSLFGAIIKCHRGFELGSETKFILCAIADDDLKDHIFKAFKDMETYSLTWVEDCGNLLLKVLDTDIDLVIIDETLPGITGSTLVEIVKKTRPRIPLIVIASGSSRQEFTKVLEQGIFYFIIKPINGEELRQAVDSGLKKSELM